MRSRISLTIYGLTIHPLFLVVVLILILGNILSQILEPLLEDVKSLS